MKLVTIAVCCLLLSGCVCLEMTRGANDYCVGRPQPSSGPGKITYAMTSGFMAPIEWITPDCDGFWEAFDKCLIDWNNYQEVYVEPTNADIYEQNQRILNELEPLRVP